MTRTLIYTAVIGIIFGLALACLCNKHSPLGIFYKSKNVLVVAPTSADFKVEACNSFDTHTRVEKIPHFMNTWQVNSECVVDSQEISVTLATFYRLWVEEFGADRDLKLFSAFNSLVIEWAEEPQLASQMLWTKIHTWLKAHSYLQTTELVYGETKNKHTIWVVRNPNGSVYDNPEIIVHELVHIALLATNPESNGDYDHEGSKSTGWTKKHTEFITSVSDYLVALK